MRKLGLIAGGGALPRRLADLCRDAGRPYLVVRLKGMADPDMAAHPGAEIGIAELGRMFDALKRGGCEAVCFAGIVRRPDFAAIKPDLRGLRALPGVLAAAGKGDDALMRHMLGEFEREGFAVEGADAVDVGLTLPLGPLGALRAEAANADEIALAVRAARAIGALDIGQAAVAVGGVVLALEAQEGTAAMLQRTATLDPDLRGSPERRRGVLAKWPKPIQERRVDLPTIGVETIEAAAAAGLAGVVGEAHGLIVLERERVIEAADRLGLFVEGLAPDAGEDAPS